MYSVNVKTENLNKSIRFFNVQTATKYALEWAKCVDVIHIDVISEETGEVGLIIHKGAVEWIGVINF